MSIATTVHLNFRDQAREALNFYQSVFGGQVVAFTYGQAQDVEHPADADRLSWGEVRTGWSPLHGMLKDRFGVIWTLDIAAQYAG